MLRAAIGASCLIFVCACSEEPGTLVVQVRTDLTPGSELTQIFTTLTPASGGSSTELMADADADLDWGVGVRVAEFADLEAGTYLLSVRGENEGVEVVQRPVRVDVAASGVRVVTVLLTRDCRGVVCPQEDEAASACLGGRCVSDTCVEEMGEECAAPECTADADCVEVLAACATSVCASSGTCFAEAVIGRCDSGQVCDVTSGCTDVNAPADGSVDAGEDAGLCPSPCGLVPQCGCPEGRNCYLSISTLQCLVDDSVTPDRSTCRASNDCLRGSACSDVPERMRNACFRMCLGGAVCDASDQCAWSPEIRIGLCRGDPCTALPQSGCPNITQSCVHVAAFDRLDVPFSFTECRDDGAFPEGDQCTRSAECESGLHCLLTAGGGQCTRYCMGPMTCTMSVGVGSVCANIGGSAALPPPGACTRPCDPLAIPGDTCAPGTACYLFEVLALPTDAPGHGSTCVTPGAGAGGAPCTTHFDCGPQMICADAACQRTCLVGSSCPSGLCQALSPAVYLGGAEYGSCPPPP